MFCFQQLSKFREIKKTLRGFFRRVQLRSNIYYILISSSYNKAFSLVNLVTAPLQLPCHVIDYYFASADVKLCAPPFKERSSFYKECSGSLQISGKSRCKCRKSSPGIINSHSLHQVEVGDRLHKHMSDRRAGLEG